MVLCYCLPGNPDKLGQHVVGQNPAAVLLQNQITLLHKRDCNRTQDLIPIPYRLDYGKRIEERCVSLKCTKWCEEILC